MAKKIGIISDTHSTTAPLQEAMLLFRKEKVDAIICAGDMAGYGADNLQDTINILRDNKCLMISGNHDLESSGMDRGSLNQEAKAFFNALPRKLELNLENIKIYVVHASPPDKQHGGIKLLDETGRVIPEQRQYWTKQLARLDCDILIIGHTHQVFVEQLGKVLVLNPGSTCFNHSCMVLSLPDLTVKIFALSNQEILKSWNWGINYKTHPDIH